MGCDRRAGPGLSTGAAKHGDHQHRRGARAQAAVGLIVLALAGTNPEQAGAGDGAHDAIVPEGRGLAPGRAGRSERDAEQGAASPYLDRLKTRGYAPLSPPRRLGTVVLADVRSPQGGRLRLVIDAASGQIVGVHAVQEAAGTAPARVP